jgi:hypothetical protein
MHPKWKDIGLGAGIIIFFVFTLFVLIPEEIFVPAGIKYRALSPAFFPRVISVLMIFLGAVLIIQTLLGPPAQPQEGASGSGKPGEEEEMQELPQRPARERILRVGAGATLMFLYYGLVHILGIVVTSIFMMPLFVLLYDERRLKLIFPLSIILAVSLYYFFAKVALIPLPKGSLFQ